MSSDPRRTASDNDIPSLSDMLQSDRRDARRTDPVEKESNPIRRTEKPDLPWRGPGVLWIGLAIFGVMLAVLVFQNFVIISQLEALKEQFEKMEIRISEVRVEQKVQVSGIESGNLFDSAAAAGRGKIDTFDSSYPKAFAPH